MVVVVSRNQKIRDLFKLFPDIKPKQAAEKLEIKYTKSFCNSFYLQKKRPLATPKKTKSNKKPIPSQEGDSAGVPLTTKLSAEYLEKCLTEALKINPNNPNLLRTAIEFFIKIKGKTDAIEDDLDMEVLKQIGIEATTGD